MQQVDHSVPRYPTHEGGGFQLHWAFWHGDRNINQICDFPQQSSLVEFYWGFGICLRERNKLFLKHKTPYSTFSLAQDFLGVFILFPAQWMDSSEFCFLPVTSILFLLARRVLSCAMALPSLIFLRHYCIPFLMTLSQPSISDMFQGRNIANLTAEATE